MVFSSLIFLYAFFPACMAVYCLAGTQKTRNWVLLLFSLVFYGWGGPKYLLLLMFMAFVSWLCALKADTDDSKKKKRWVIIAAVIDIGLIGWFKYAGFLWGIFGTVPEFVANIALPIGISFYTFQLLTYVVDVSRGEAPAQRSYWNVLLYAALFHQCIAGPIVRYKTIDRELFGTAERKPEIANGVTRFCLGLAKKVLLANPCGALADSLILSTEQIADVSQFAANLASLEKLSVLGSWVGMIAYALHIYLDFSAYSDMAIGMGQMVGLHYLENFNYPYISRSITEFWRRWHISLGTFFRDYVYIPLGGNRGTFLRVTLNTFVVWALTGLWHGASWNFVLWGLWFFLLLMIERIFLKKWLIKVPVLSNAYVLAAVIVGWVIFRFSDLQLMGALLRGLFGCNGNPLSDFTSVIQLQNNLYLLLFAGFASTPCLKWACEKLDRIPGWSLVYRCLLPAALLLLSTACLVGDSYNPFIYFQF